MDRKAAGWVARHRGRAFERELEVYHRHLAALGLAVVYRTGPAVEFKRGGVPFVVGPGITDFAGVIRGGRGIFLEAKTTQNARRFTPHKGGEHQAEFMRRALELGALAGYIVRWQDQETRLHPPRVPLVREDGELLEGVQWYDALHALDTLPDEW